MRRGRSGKAVLVHLDKPQVPELRHRQQRLHRERLARAALAVEQDIIHLPALHQGTGVSEHLLPLALKAQNGLGTVRIGDGQQRSVLPYERPVAGETPGAAFKIAVPERFEG